MIQHAYYLIKKFWKTKINFSFPRIQPASGGFKPLSKVTDKNMVQLISVLRIMFNDSELLLSTRENKNIRNNFLNIGITQISAGSKTNPGGYSNIKKSDNQFDISDKRSVEEIISFLKKRGFDPVIKNWDNKYKQYIG
jgi:2-iminoacetate synthase